MKKITFRADTAKLELAERIAEERGTTLGEEVRQWLSDFGEGKWKLATLEPKKQKGRTVGEGLAPAYGRIAAVPVLFNPCCI